MSERALPDAIERHLGRVLPDGGEAASRVRLTQRGDMVQKPDGRRLEFTAVEQLEVGHVEFEWRASFGTNPFVRVRVTDLYRDGEGLLIARVWGLVPATRNTGPETDRGEAMRYLAELPWVPYAMSANRELSWRQLDDGEVEVSTLVGGIAASVRLAFDESGLVKRASAMRPRVSGGAWVDTPWVGEFGDYVEVGGIRVPASAEVSWELAEGPFTYWRGEVTSLVAE
jgi:Family of unknown function (DUF6920)